jgi:hypothetical protein
MDVKILLALIAATLLGIGTTYAGSKKCPDDARNWAELDYPPGTSVTMVATTNPKRFCRFSINGFVADRSAPKTMLKAMNEFSTKRSIVALAAKSPTQFVTKALPYLLFSADEDVDEELLEGTTDALQKYKEKFVSCVEEFFRKKRDYRFAAKYENLALSCTTSIKTDNLKTKLNVLDSPVVRVTYLTR